MMDEKLFERLDSWTQAQLDGELTDQQHVELETALRDDAEARRLYIELIHQHAAMRRLLGHIPACEPATALGSKRDAIAGEEHVAGCQSPTLAGRLTNFFARPMPMSITVAAMIMVALLTALHFVVPPATVRDDDAESPSPDWAVARVTGVQDAVWAEGQASVFTGTDLTAGQVLDLESGLVEVTFQDGARALLEGPAVFRVDSKNAATLERGKLAGRIGNGAHGFIVHTEYATVTDLGTEFGVEAGEESTHVAVYEGIVLFAPTDAEASQRAVQVNAGGVATATRSGGLTASSTGAEKLAIQREIRQPTFSPGDVIHVDIHANAGGAYSGRGANGTGGTWNTHFSLRDWNLLKSDGTVSPVAYSAANWDGVHKTLVSTHANLEDYLFDRTPDPVDATLTISGLDDSLLYDLYIYAGVEGGIYEAGGKSAKVTYQGPGANDPDFARGAVLAVYEDVAQTGNTALLAGLAPTGGQIKVACKTNPQTFTAAQTGDIVVNLSGFTLVASPSAVASKEPAR